MQPALQSPVRLYCFPYAGASSSVYRPWELLAPPVLRIRGVESPGRGTRMREPAASDYRSLVQTLADSVTADLLQARDVDPHVRYATFGHSFGSLLSVSVGATLAHALKQRPLRAFLSAGLPPRLHPSVDELAPFTDQEVLDKIVADGGTSPEILTSKAMRRILVRQLRQDHSIRRQFSLERGLCVDFPLTLIAARDDGHISPHQVWQWSEHSTGACRRVEIPGGHFAAFQEPDQIIAIINDDVFGDASASVSMSTTHDDWALSSERGR